MAKLKVTTCRHCGKEVAKSAKKCPHCGGKNQNTKKLWAITIALFAFCFILPALTEGTDNSTKNSESPGAPTEIVSPKDTNQSSSGIKTTQKEKEVSPSLPKLESTVIYEGNNVTMTATGIKKKGNDFFINILIENNSSLNLGFNAHSYAINGIMTKNNIYAMDCDVAAGKKANVSLELKANVLKEYGITEIRCVDALFWAYDNDKSFKEFETGQVEIKTDLYNEKHDLITGTNIYNTNGIRVDYLSCAGDTYKFCISNNTGTYFDFDFSEITINGFTNSKTDFNLHNVQLLNDSQVVVAVKVDNDFKSTNNVNKVETIEWNMEIRSNGDYFNDEKIGPIVYSVQ